MLTHSLIVFSTTSSLIRKLVDLLSANQVLLRVTLALSLLLLVLRFAALSVTSNMTSFTDIPFTHSNDRAASKIKVS